MSAKETRELFRLRLKEIYPQQETDSIFYILIEHLGGISKTQFMVEPDQQFNKKLSLHLMKALEELEGLKPVQYITGKTVFCGLDIQLNPDVLIPRPETEELVHWIISENNADNELKILDIGTGSGCIALALKSMFKQAKVYATDISEGAIKVARDNAEHNMLEVAFLQDDIIMPSSVLPWFDVIVSNPPYVSLSESASMHRNILDFEPHSALFVENDNPFIFYDAIMGFAMSHLNVNGKIYFEINQYLAEPLALHLVKYGTKKPELKRDINGNFRFLRI